MNCCASTSCTSITAVTCTADPVCSVACVGRVLADLFAARREKRVVVACFASHIHRVQQIADAAIAEGRADLAAGRVADNEALRARFAPR